MNYIVMCQLCATQIPVTYDMLSLNLLYEHHFSCNCICQPVYLYAFNLFRLFSVMQLLHWDSSVQSWEHTLRYQVLQISTDMQLMSAFFLVLLGHIKICVAFPTI